MSVSLLPGFPGSGIGATFLLAAGFAAFSIRSDRRRSSSGVSRAARLLGVAQVGGDGVFQRPAEEHVQHPLPGPTAPPARGPASGGR